VSAGDSKPRSPAVPHAQLERLSLYSNSEAYLMIRSVLFICLCTFRIPYPTLCLSRLVARYSETLQNERLEKTRAPCSFGESPRNANATPYLMVYWRVVCWRWACLSACAKRAERTERHHALKHHERKEGTQPTNTRYIIHNICSVKQPEIKAFYRTTMFNDLLCDIGT
jgi:hypothetical protein